MDTVITIGDFVIQHGRHNDRVYLMKVGKKSDVSRLVKEVERLAVQNGYGKIFAKIPASIWDTFERAEYVVEASIPGLFNRQEDGLFIAKYPAPERAAARPTEELLEIIRS